MSTDYPWVFEDETSSEMYLLKLDSYYPYCFSLTCVNTSPVSWKLPIGLKQKEECHLHEGDSAFPRVVKELAFVQDLKMILMTTKAKECFTCAAHLK